jgi:hypothetical protein
MLWALTGAPFATFGRPGNEWLVTPDFEGARFSLEGHGRFTLFPAQVIGIVIAFLLSPAALRVARELYKVTRS